MMYLLLIVSSVPTVLGFETPSGIIGKCKDTMPNFPGLDVTEGDGEIFQFIYTPDSVVYRTADSIAMSLKQKEDNNTLFSLKTNIRSVVGAKTSLAFIIEDLGHGVFKKVGEDTSAAAENMSSRLTAFGRRSLKSCSFCDNKAIKALNSLLDGTESYKGSVVDIKGDVGLLYLCNENRGEELDDSLFVVARTSVNASSVLDPEVLFKDSIDKHNFKVNFRKLRMRFNKYNLKF